MEWHIRNMPGEIREPVPRVEVLSMWFQTNDLHRDRDQIVGYLCHHRKPLFRSVFELKPRLSQTAKDYIACDELYRVAPLTKDPSNFKGRILILCECDFHEIYNSDTRLKDDDSQYTNLALIDEEYHDSVVGGGDTSYNLHLPVMGPRSGCLGIEYSDQFYVIVHRDSGDSTIDDSYVASAPIWLEAGIPLRCDDWSYWNGDTGWEIDERFEFKVDGLFYSLILDCIVYSDSKLVSVVEVKWFFMDDENNSTPTRDIYICGELSVISSNDDIKSLLLNTPPDKAIKVLSGQPIPLLKSVVAIPYDSDFKFCAKLGRPINVVDDDSAFYFPTVNSSIRDCDCDTRKRESSMPSTSDLNLKFHVPGGYLEVTATIDMQ